MAQTIRRAASPVADQPFYTDRLPDFDYTLDAHLAWLRLPAFHQGDDGLGQWGSGCGSVTPMRARQHSTDRGAASWTNQEISGVSSLQTSDVIADNTPGLFSEELPMPRGAARGMNMALSASGSWPRSFNGLSLLTWFGPDAGRLRVERLAGLASPPLGCRPLT
jgi:hypothetical protein